MCRNRTYSDVIIHFSSSLILSSLQQLVTLSSKNKNINVFYLKSRLAILRGQYPTDQTSKIKPPPEHLNQGTLRLKPQPY